MAAPEQTPSLTRLEQELHALRQQHEALLRAIAHDLRAPLRHIQSFAPMLTEAVQDLASHAAPAQQEAAADALEFSHFMQQGATKLAAMIQGLTALSQAARQPLTLQAVDALALYRQLAAQQYPHALLHYPDDAPTLWLLADRAALERILRELLDNACKFIAPNSRPEITLSAEQQAQRWHITLFNQGVGFENNQAATQLGHPFVRLHRESEFPAGIGCGLAIAQALAQRQGGQLSLRAEVGRGCAVLLDWPSVALSSNFA